MTILEGRPDVAGAGAVLVVGDEVAARDALRRVLAGEHYDAPTTPEALARPDELSGSWLDPDARHALCAVVSPARTP